MSRENDYYIEIEPSVKDDDESNLDTENLTLPSDLEQPIRRKRRGTRKKKKSIKLWVIIAFVAAIYLFYDAILSWIMDILKSNPTVYSIYLAFEAEIVNNTVKGLFLVSIFGSLFFLAIPSEALFIYFLDSTNYYAIVIILLMVFGNLAGLAFNYIFGRAFGERFVRMIFTSSFDKYKEKIEKYGGIILLLGNIFPGPIEVLSVFYGSFKFNFKRYLFLAFMGRLIKYLILFCIFYFYWDSIMLFYDEVYAELETAKVVYSSLIK